MQRSACFGIFAGQQSLKRIRTGRSIGTHEKLGGQLRCRRAPSRANRCELRVRRLLVIEQVLTSIRERLNLLQQPCNALICSFHGADHAHLNIEDLR
jgi:hypothetical protein